MKEQKENKIIDLKDHQSDKDQNFHSKFGNYQPDDDLLQSTTRIKNQRDVILERMDRMELSHDRVSQAVFDKVRRDYTLQLQTISELLNEKKDSLKKEIKELYLRREKLSVEIHRHKEILEEADFRHYLGEFSKSQFEEVETYESKEIEKLETDLSRISSYIRAHEDLFDPEDLGEKRATRPAAHAPAPQHAPAAPQTPAPQAHVPQPQPEPVAPAQPAAPAPEPQVQAPVQQTQEPVPAQPVAPEPAPAPAAQVSEPVETSPSVSYDENSIATRLGEAQEFESLFVDSDEEESSELSQSQLSIRKILDDEPDTPAQTSSPEPSSASTSGAADSSNYFEESSVNESSFTIDPEVVHDDLTPPAGTAAAMDQTAQTDISENAPAESQKSAIEDSISEILSTIQIDEDEPQASEAPQAAPSSKTGNQFYLTLIDGDLEEKDYVLTDNMSIGRSSTNDIVLKAPKVSRQHAAINLYNGQYIIIDLKSSNGVFVNGTKVDECTLNEGDEVSVGGYKFLFVRR